MVRFFKILFLIFFISVVSTFGQNIRVTASTDTSDYLVGDYINFTIKVEFDEGIRISPPSLTQPTE